MDLSIDTRGDYTDDSAFYDDPQWIKECKTQVYGESSRKKLHRTLQQLATGLEKSTQQIIKLQRDLKDSRCKWIDENTHHRTASAKLRHACDQLLSGPLHTSQVCKQGTNGCLPVSHTPTRPPVPVLQDVRHMTSTGLQQKLDPSMLHRRLRMMLETSTETLRSTPARSTAAKQCHESPTPTLVTPSGLYLMVDATTGRPLGDTLLHADVVDAVRQRVHQAPGLHSPASHVPPASLARSSCHTQTGDSITTSPSQPPQPQAHHVSELTSIVGPCEQESQSWLGASSHTTDHVSDTLPEQGKDSNVVPHSLRNINASCQSAHQHQVFQQENEKTDHAEDLDRGLLCSGLQQDASDWVSQLKCDADDCASDTSQERDQSHSAQGVDISVCGIQELPEIQRSSVSSVTECVDSMAATVEVGPPATDLDHLEQCHPIEEEHPACTLEAAQPQPAVSEISFDNIQPLKDSSECHAQGVIVNTSGCSLDLAGVSAACASDAHSDGSSTSLLQKSMRESMLLVNTAAKQPHSNTSDRHSNSSRRSSIVPVEDMLPHMPKKPAQGALSKHSAASALLGLLKEESDVFEDDAPLNFLKPSATASSQPKSYTNTSATITQRPGVGGFDFTRPSMDASLGSYEGAGLEELPSAHRNDHMKRQSQENGNSRSNFGESSPSGMDIDDFDF